MISVAKARSDATAHRLARIAFMAKYDLPHLGRENVTEDVAVPVHDTQRCQAASGKYSAALRQPQAGIGDDQPNTFQGSFLEVLEECAPALVVLLGPFTDAQNLPITVVVRRPQLTARH
jgi:hypothetical protein